ncbi:MAG TPA: DoxX family membrane protein [Allosphingosinicella sp.]|jgi:uncharacterized membrane protein YphA (DoxX/SURF4 family)
MSISVRVYGLAAVALGVPGLVYASFAAMGLPVPPHAPGYQILAYAAAGLLVLAGLAVNIRRTAPAASLALAAFFALCVLALHVPRAFAQPTVWVSYEGVAEVMVMALGGVLAFTLVPGPGERRAAAILRIARSPFGLCLIVFGTSEYVYAAFTASLVPAWLPLSQLFWTYLTGAAQIAAGLAILTGVKARLAAILLTTMYLIFGLIVHLPRVIADPSGAGRWAENGVNLVLAGAAWVLVDCLARAGMRSRR